MVIYMSVLRKHENKQSIHSHLTTIGSVSVNSSKPARIFVCMIRQIREIYNMADGFCGIVLVRIVKWIAMLSTFLMYGGIQPLAT